MRRAQLVRRRKVSSFLFFAGFLWVGTEMGLDIKSGLITKDLSVFLERRLNNIFVDKNIRVASIQGNGFRNFAVKDLSVSRKSDSTPLFSVDKIIIKYGLLNLALRRFDELERVYLVSPSLIINPNQNGDFSLSKSVALHLPDASSSAGHPLKFYILNGNIAVLGKEPMLRNLEGVVTFKGWSLSFKDLKGTFLNIPVLVSGRIDNLTGNPLLKIRIEVRDRHYTAQCTLKSTGWGQGLVWGRLKPFAGFSIPFKGEINIASGNTLRFCRLVVANPFDNKTAFVVTRDMEEGFIITPTVKVTPEGVPGFIKIINRLDFQKGLNISAKINHMKFLGHDVLSQLNISTNFLKNISSEELLKGSLRTENLILNYRPFKELNANWILKKKELFITNLELGDEYRLFGKIRLGEPYDIDLNLSINNADMASWLIFSRYGQQQDAVSGLISGKVRLRGPLERVVTDGGFNIAGGNIGDIKFDAINFNLKGKGPLLTVSDSRILKEGGFLYIDGEVDLRKLGKRNIFEDVKITTDQKVVVWEGWDISKDTTQIKATKELGDEFGVNFKTYMDRGETGYSQKKNEIGLDYKIKKDDHISLRMKDDSAFVGVEHKVKF